MEKLEKKINYTFKDKSRLTTALTHSSYVNESKIKSNQRLEFLGDAVLQIVISDLRFKRLPDTQEGDLSKKRSLIVCCDSLYIVGTQIGISDYLLLGKGEEESMGRKKKNIIADAVEAVIGAIYLDGGIDEARKFITDFLGDIIERSIKGQITYDFKTSLQEFTLKHHMGQPSYSLVETKGPEHDMKFWSKVTIMEMEFFGDEGHNRKE